MKLILSVLTAKIFLLHNYNLACIWLD